MAHDIHSHNVTAPNPA